MFDQCQNECGWERNINYLFITIVLIFWVIFILFFSSMRTHFSLLPSSDVQQSCSSIRLSIHIDVVVIVDCLIIIVKYAKELFHMKRHDLALKIHKSWFFHFNFVFKSNQNLLLYVFCDLFFVLGAKKSILNFLFFNSFLIKSCFERVVTRNK